MTELDSCNRVGVSLLVAPKGIAMVIENGKNGKKGSRMKNEERSRYQSIE